MKSTDKLLRNALKANATFSFTSGLLLTIFSPEIGGFMHILAPDFLLYIGIGLMLFAGLVFYNGLKNEIDAKQVKFIILQDWIWVAGSVIVVGFDPFGISFNGNLLIGFVAGVVALFAVLQTKSLRNVHKTAA